MGLFKKAPEPKGFTRIDAAKLIAEARRDGEKVGLTTPLNPPYVANPHSIVGRDLLTYELHYVWEDGFKKGQDKRREEIRREGGVVKTEPSIVPVLWNYNYEEVIGSATLEEDGNVHIKLTDPRVIENVVADAIKGVTLSREPNYFTDKDQ